MAQINSNLAGFCKKGKVAYFSHARVTSVKSQQEQKVTDGVTRQDNGSENNITRDLAHPMRNLNVADVLISKDIKNIRRKKMT